MIFDLFFSLGLYKNDELFYLGKYLTFFFYGFKPSNTQILITEDKIIVAIVKTYRDNKSNNVSIYNIEDVF